MSNRVLILLESLCLKRLDDLETVSTLLGDGVLTSIGLVTSSNSSNPSSSSS